MTPTIFNRLDLSQLSGIHGNHHQSVSDEPASTAIANGQFHLSKTFSDVLIHISDLTELEPLSFTCERAAELTVGVLVEGKLQFALDDKEVILEVAPGERPLCFAFNILRPVKWRRDLIKDNRVKKALVCIPHTWLKKRLKSTASSDGFLQRLALLHNFVSSRQAGFQLHNTATKLIACGKIEDSGIELEGLALILMSQCLKALKQNSNTASKTTSATTEVLSNQASPTSTESFRICQFIENQITEDTAPISLELSHISKQLGVSVSTAQRQFKRDFKVTIMDYIRARRLEIARTQLQKQLSIGEVAYMAGYAHTSNFSLAFKKHFGVSPGNICKLKYNKIGAIQLNSTTLR